MLHQDYFQKPKPFLLGSYVNYITFPIEKSNLTWNFWIQTIHNIDWGFAVDTTESDKTNNVKFSIYQKKTPENFRSIELDVGIVVDNLENSEYSIKVSGNYEFTEENNNMVIEIPGFDKIIDWKQGFYDDKAEEKKFKIRYNMVVKSVRLYDSVELFDFYNFDPTIFDTSVKAFGHTMFVSKKMISLQSAVLSGMIEAQNIEWTDLPSTCWFDIFHDFLQIIHGVDLFLYKSNIGEFLKLADHLKAPRITEYCKKQMINGSGGISLKETIDLAEKWSLWDVIPRKLAQARCLADLKAQNWELDNLDDSIIKQITRRIFELDH